MSIRAYRAEIKTEKEPSFNLWNDEKLCDFLAKPFLFLGAEGGLISVEVNKIEEALDVLDLSEHIKNALKKDIEYAQKNNEEYITYYCY